CRAQARRYRAPVWAEVTLRVIASDPPSLAARATERVSVRRSTERVGGSEAISAHVQLAEIASACCARLAMTRYLRARHAVAVLGRDDRLARAGRTDPAEREGRHDGEQAGDLGRDHAGECAIGVIRGDPAHRRSERRAHGLARRPKGLAMLDRMVAA